VQSGEVPHLVLAEPPRPRIEAIRIVDMSVSNSWAEFAALFRNTRSAFLDHERAKSELKALMPEDAKEAIGHGVKAKRDFSGLTSSACALAKAEASAATVSLDRGNASFSKTSKLTAPELRCSGFGRFSSL
jgi:hypothetical protein